MGPLAATQTDRLREHFAMQKFVWQPDADGRSTCSSNVLSPPSLLSLSILFWHHKVFSRASVGVVGNVADKGDVFVRLGTEERRERERERERESVGWRQSDGGRPDD